jgi:2-keto-4-pentenoate hydratase/2-oxohepta-3-ene-1,7-dioic acid hydratase in catechol pathway
VHQREDGGGVASAQHLLGFSGHFQHGGSTELIRDIPEIVRYVSAVMTLLPGDIIYTGTPGEPPQIKTGDDVEIEVTGAGILRNGVV